ncbi:MAG: hypothetical protein WC337_08700 [Candidatus Muiribacteriota bacterium]
MNKKKLFLIIIIFIFCQTNSLDLNIDKNNLIKIAKEEFINKFNDINFTNFKTSINRKPKLFGEYYDSYQVKFMRYIHNYNSNISFTVELDFNGNILKTTDLDDYKNFLDSIDKIYYSPALILSKKQAEEKVKYVYEKIARTKNFTILNDEEFKIEYPKQESYRPYDTKVYFLTNYNKPVWITDGLTYPVNAALNGWNWDNVNWKNVKGESFHDSLQRVCWMVGTAIKNENSYSWLTIFYVDVETGEIISGNGYLSNILSVLMENYEPDEEL